MVAAASEDLHWSSTGPIQIYAVARACFQNGDDEAGEGDVAKQDEMSAHDPIRSATASEL